MKGVEMITDDDVRQLFQDSWSVHSQHVDHGKPLFDQFFRGKTLRMWEGQRPGGCNRHMTVFKKFNVIPEYCFSCYKILVEPRTVVELFKLMVVFDKLKLPADNTRKCMVECRKQVSGSYKGFIYCRSIEEGEEILKMVQKVVSQDISKEIPATLKRGCSEYALAYPEYAQAGKDAEVMEYRDEWREYEELADKSLGFKTPPTGRETFDTPAYTQRDAEAMYYWLTYAATIGDLSYLKISGLVLSPFQNLDRPSPFQAVEGD